MDCLELVPCHTDDFLVFGGKGGGFLYILQLQCMHTKYLGQSTTFTISTGHSQGGEIH